MALAPQFAASHRLGPATARHTLEQAGASTALNLCLLSGRLYLDYVCPFSAKQLKGVKEHLVPLIDKKGADSLSIIIRQTPQPWHASSTLVHQAGIAVARLAPQKFWQFSYDLMEASSQYYDEPTLDETPRKTRERLADLASKSVGVDRQAFLDLILTGKGNSGSKVDADLKLAVKIGRQNGIHVTPTAVLDGLVDPSISSSFGSSEWGEWFSKLS